MKHPSEHEITDIYGNTIKVNSLHHQMQYPYDLPEEDYKLIAWADSLSPFHQHMDGDKVAEYGAEMNKEPEIVYYPKIKALAIQHHPEMLKPDHIGRRYARELVNRLLDDKI